MAGWLDGTPGLVTFPDGCRVRGRGLRAPRGDGPEPRFGVYLLGADPGPRSWPYRWVRCPDFRVPVDRDDALAALAEAHRRAFDERVEIGCGAGVGRTGLGLAVVAIFSGVPATGAVAWVRAAYHPRAVETPWQRRWVARLGRAH